MQKIYAGSARRDCSTDRSVPNVCELIHGRDDAVQIDGSLSIDDGLSKKPICDCVVLCGVGTTV